MVTVSKYDPGLFYYTKDDKLQGLMVCFVGDSSNINEVIRAVLNSLLLFFTKRFYTHILTKHKI